MSILRKGKLTKANSDAFKLLVRALESYMNKATDEEAKTLLGLIAQFNEIIRKGEAEVST